METEIIQCAKELSEKLIKQAGLIAKEKFGNIEHLRAKDSFGDVVTEVDHMAEAIILKGIQSAFPYHQIHSEEAGDNGIRSDWLWLIDPLDGTNNFAIGLPVFSTSITLMYKKEPVLGVVYEPMTDRLFESCINEGAHCNGTKMKMKSNDNFRRGNIGWIQGHNVQNDIRAVTLRQHIDLNCKRMMRLWAPTLQWCMLAKGDIDGIVLYNSAGDDLYSGILMVKEAGGIVTDFEGNPFTGMKTEPYIIACHPDHKDELIKVVKEGLGLFNEAN
ncbi:inositol monophosphatase family protein [Paenibacillus puldeungensis]|uniref:Inositol monophosphatase family protein n=1 Tax=Paenibacillus puldeungensis TaxID=696536 RepID=A0ABW3S1F9_9BACL